MAWTSAGLNLAAAGWADAIELHSNAANVSIRPINDRQPLSHLLNCMIFSPSVNGGGRRPLLVPTATVTAGFCRARMPAA
jgi:hypothetical protein